MKQTKYVVIGHPIGHTMSPFIHAGLFSLRNVPGVYGKLDVPNLAEAMPALRDLDGFNVTIPHKSAIIPFLDALDDRAALYGSVNTVENRGGQLIGHTTDGVGFTKALESAGATLAQPVLVLGAGGVSRVMALEALLAGAPEVAIAARDGEKAAALALELSTLAQKIGKTPVFRGLSINSLENNPGNWGLLANGTPVGMYPKPGDCPVSPRIVEACGWVFDAVYNPDRTLLLETAIGLGKSVVHGMDMLVWQAAAAQEYWLGQQFKPEEVAPLCAAAVEEMNRLFGQRE